jgi:CheY-like chemotaxis protein
VPETDFKKDFLEMLILLRSKLDLIEDDEISINAKLALSECRQICSRAVNILDPKTPLAEAQAGNPLPTEKTVKLLVIDDSEDILRVLKYSLAKKGIDVHLEKNPITALNSLVQLQPDAILLDLMMPEMTGFEVLQRIRHCTDQNLRKIKIIIGSSRTYDKDRLSVLEAGADEFVSKPYNMGELAIRIKKLVA